MSSVSYLIEYSIPLATIRAVPSELKQTEVRLGRDPSLSNSAGPGLVYILVDLNQESDLSARHFSAGPWGKHIVLLFAQGKHMGIKALCRI